MTVDFHPEKVRNIANGAAEKFLKRAGGYLRTAAKRSIRKRKKPSAPGAPPSSHTGALRNFIRFEVEGSKRVVVGPQKLSGKKYEQPRVLELGGETGYRERGGNIKTIRVAARPFMVPALNATIKVLPTLWQVRRTGR